MLIASAPMNNNLTLSSKEMIDLPKIEQYVIELSKEVGYFIQQESICFDKSNIEQKDSFHNLVSYVDRESEKKIVQGLQKILPKSGILAEEGTSLKGENGYHWIIDPLDGTTNFYHALPPYAISIGLAKGNDIILGVVYEITKKECFHAVKGGTSYCNGKKISIAKNSSLSKSLLSTGFPYRHFDKEQEYLSLIKVFMRQTQGIRRIGSASVDLVYVACGRLDGFFEYDLQPWDVAAGSLIVEQAGGKISDFRGNRNFIFDKEICAAGKIHADMIEILAQHWAIDSKVAPTYGSYHNK